MIAAAAGLFFYPQIAAFFAKKSDKGNVASHTATTGAVPAPRPSRSATITELLDIQDRVADIAPEAATEIGNAVHALIGGKR